MFYKIAHIAEKIGEQEQREPATVKLQRRKLR